MSAQQSQPSEAELRAYLEQLRDAEPSQIVLQAFSMLGTGAEVKLGRRDARVLIDAMAGLVEAVRAHLPDDLREQMTAGVRQLQLGQVQLEQERAKAAASADEGADSGAPQQDAPPQPSQQPSGDTAGSTGSTRMTDRLWIPGRDAPPR